MPCPANELGLLPPIRGGLRSAGLQGRHSLRFERRERWPPEGGRYETSARSARSRGALASCGVRRLAAAVCRPGLPGRAPRHQPRSIHRAMQARPGRASALNLLSTSIPNFSPQARQASPAIQRRQAAALHISCLGCDSTHVANQCHAHSGRSGHRQARTKKYRSPRRAFDARSYARRIRLLLRERGDA